MAQRKTDYPKIPSIKRKAIVLMQSFVVVVLRVIFLPPIFLLHILPYLRLSHIFGLAFYFGFWLSVLLFFDEKHKSYNCRRLITFDLFGGIFPLFAFLSHSFSIYVLSSDIYPIRWDKLILMNWIWCTAV